MAGMRVLDCGCETLEQHVRPTKSLSSTIGARSDSYQRFQVMVHAKLNGLFIRSAWVEGRRQSMFPDFLHALLPEDCTTLATLRRPERDEVST